MMNKPVVPSALKIRLGLMLITGAALFGQIAEPPPLVSINLKEASFNNVLRILGEKTGLKFVADPEIQERCITVNLNNVTPEDAITAIMNSSGLAYRKIDRVDIYSVGDVRTIQQHTVIKNYRCQYADAVELQNALNRLATPGVGLPIGQRLGIGMVARSFDAVLNSRQSDKEVNILSRPYLIALDNKTAQIEAGDQIPYKVLNQYEITSYEFKSATIKIGNGETIVIDGLIRESNTKSISKGPLPGTIPLIGALFRNKIDQKVKTELVVFINPTIATDNIIDSQLQPDSQLSEKARRKMEQLEEKNR